MLPFKHEKSNDILFDGQHYFGDANIHEIVLGDDTYYSMFVMEPLVEINNKVYYLTDAFSLNILNEAMMSDIEEAFSFSNLCDWYPKGFEQLEAKLLERDFC